MIEMLNQSPARAYQHVYILPSSLSKLLHLRRMVGRALHFPAWRAHALQRNYIPPRTAVGSPALSFLSEETWLAGRAAREPEEVDGEC